MSCAPDESPLPRAHRLRGDPCALGRRRSPLRRSFPCHPALVASQVTKRFVPRPPSVCIPLVRPSIRSANFFSRAFLYKGFLSYEECEHLITLVSKILFRGGTFLVRQDLVSNCEVCCEARRRISWRNRWLRTMSLARA